MPNPETFKKGFTLIELLVAIAIIAVISVVAVALFSNVQKNARDARRHSDVEMISKAYEINRTSSGQYQTLNPTSFSKSEIPQDPRGGDYFNVLASDGSGFRVCAALEGNAASMCNVGSANCVCKESALGTISSTATLTGPGSGMGLLAGGGGGIEHPLSCDASGTLDDQLISYWKMDESSWTNDCSTDSAMDAASSNHADSCPAGGGMTTPVAGKFSNAASFDGVDDFLNARSAAALDNLGTAGMTLSAWINPEPLGAQSYLLMAKSTSDTPAQGWKWVITPVRRMEFHVDFGTTSSDSLFRTSSTTVTTGAWNHIAVTWTGSNDLNMMKMYINGTEVAYINGRNGCNDGTPVPCNFVSDAIHDLRIGSAPTMSVSARYYGKMDDARVYSRVLTAGEISSLYNGGTGCIPS